MFIIASIVALLGNAQAAEPLVGWSTEFGPTGLYRSGYIAAAVEFEGDLVVAGWFETAGRDTVEHIARWNGEHWLPLGSGLRSVGCLAVHDGHLVAGGKFKATSDIPASGLVYWDGEAWQGYSDRLQGEVLALTTYRGELVVGGRFTIEGETPIRHIARWDGTSWRSLGRGVARGGRTRIEALEVHGDELIAAGVFGRAGSMETFHIARWDGQEWKSFGTGADDAVNAVRSSGSLLYAGGRFREVDGDSASCVAVWDGVSWSALGAGIRQESFGEPFVNTLEIWRDQLVVAGKFDSAGGLPVGSIATWDSQEWNPEPPGFFDNPRRMNPEEVLDLAVYDGRLVAGGKMKGGAGFLINHLGLWDGWHWDPLVAGQGVEGGVTEMKYLGGRLMLQANGATGSSNFRGIAVWEDGRWRPFETGNDNTVVFKAELKLFTEHKGQILAFGKLYDVVPENACQKGEYTWRLAAWDDGWRTVSPPLEPKVDWPHRLVSVGNDVVVLGSFTGPLAESGRGVVWDGIQWRSLGLEEEISNLGCSAVIDGHLFLAWQTRSEDDPPRFSVAEWDGGQWRVIKSGIHSEVKAMTERDGRLVASFSIPHEECSESSNIQEWDGNEWLPLPGSFSYRHDQDGRVQQLAMYQGHLVASGSFKGVDNLACRKVAFWDGGIWRPLDGGVTGQEVHRLIPTETSLWLGGGFAKAGEEMSIRVARWDGPLPVNTPVDSLPAYMPEEKPATRRGDGWHSHALDMTDPPPPFANGDFLTWSDGLPDRWEWRTSSRRNCPSDSIPPQALPDGGVSIKASGDKGCYASLAQRFEVDSDRFYRVRARYEMSEATVKGRWPACRMSVGDYQRQPTGYDFGPLHRGMWAGLEGGKEQWAEVILRTDSKANVGVVTFSSRTAGAELLVREVVVDTISMSGDDITRLLLSELRDKYVPQFDGLVDWEGLERQFTGMEADNAQSYDRLMIDLLKSLAESRVTLESGEADVTNVASVTKEDPVPDEDRLTRERVAAIREQLMDWVPSGGRAMGWTRDGLAYVNLSNPRVGNEQLLELATADGILIDMRASGYRSLSRHREYEQVLELAGCFTAKPRVFGYTTSSHGGQAVEDTLRVQPSADHFLGMPVVCLIGQGCKGQGTEFVMMMKAMPNVTLVGRPTRGGTGGMAKFSLPTGSHVNYPSRSMWSSDRELINDSHGLQADVTVEPDGSPDPVFAEGLRILQMKIADSER